MYTRTSGDYWIGLYKSAAVAIDNCYWLDGNPSTFRNWAAGEPNTVDMCIRMVSGGLHRDIACNSLYGYVCKADEGIFTANSSWHLFTASVLVRASDL